ncbi:uncharacterized protein CCR75_001507 [Bremia lactucae]|uniref:Protein kinase domain-containing protein n=1 Tax=Bremia lactucae TaxID=4779 RepID=A0A976FGM6_BRELC|nr:hypothetical protein CCR75_001507 [Bremia lactucae]
MSVSFLSVATVLTTVHARTDIVAQLYGNTAITAPTPPTSLNLALQELVVSVANFTQYPAALQRAMLWSAGWVRAQPEAAILDESSSAATYVQVYVLCDRTMSDVFQSPHAFDDPTRCGIKECKSTLVSFTKSTCDPDYVRSRALCAISPDATFEFVPPLQTKNGPLWAMDGQIDATFDPQLFQYANASSNTSTPLFLLTQKSAWTTMKDDDTCPNSAQFIAPCQRVDASEVDPSTQQRTWCVPTIELGVKLWVEQIQNVATGVTVPDAKSTFTLAAILAILLGLFIVAAIVLCILWHRTTRFVKNGLHANGNNTFFVQPLSFHHRRSLPLEGTTSGPYTSSPEPRWSYDHGMQIEATNETFRRRSPELAAFCDDHELMLKRIAFAGIIYRDKLTSGPTGEVWRGEYEGRHVAIKCTVAAAVAVAHRGSFGMIAPVATSDFEIQTLVAFTKEIRMAARLDHVNIVGFIGFSWRTLPDLCIVSEYIALALRELANQCLDYDPSKRPSAMQIVYNLRSKIFLTL